MLERSEQNKRSIAVDLLIAVVPVMIWAIFLYGGRAAVLMGLCGFFCLLFDFPVQFFIKKKRGICAVNPFTFLSGVLASFFLPVTVPLWILPIVAALLVLCRSFSGYFKHRVFNSAVFSVFIATLLFQGCLERYTKPFSYFSPFEIAPNETLVNAYRVFSPLQLMQSKVYYEDGLLAQFYGIASGAIGTAAVLCLLLSFVWLLLRKHAFITSTLPYLLSIAVLSAATAPDELEMISFVCMNLLSGSVVILAVFAMNDFSSVPNPSYRYARIAFGVLAGALTVLFRSFDWGTAGDLAPVLVGNLLTPLLEKLSDPLLHAKIKNRFGRSHEKPVDTPPDR